MTLAAITRQIFFHPCFIVLMAQNTAALSLVSLCTQWLCICLCACFCTCLYTLVHDRSLPVSIFSLKGPLSAAVQLCFFLLNNFVVFFSPEISGSKHRQTPVTRYQKLLNWPNHVILLLPRSNRVPLRRPSKPSYSKNGCYRCYEVTAPSRVLLRRSSTKSSG